jgi:misacylated tRNA(Ala) deacylase
MTEKLYWRDMYQKEFEARVVKVLGNSVVLDRTCFYPTGGGEPNDTGRLMINGAEYGITDVKKEGEEITHYSGTAFNAKAGDAVRGVIDWDRRYAYMRLHTAIHLLDAVVEKFYASGMITGGQIYDDRARIDIDMQGLNREKLQEILDKTNSIAREGREVVARMISREEALKDPRLARTEPGKALINSLDSIRVVEIVGLDEQADGGMHVRNTSEIGAITLSKYENKGSHNKRVEITLNRLADLQA